MSKLWLLLAMILTGIIYAVVLLYIMPMSQSNNILLHCILLGVLFGVVNFIVAVLYYRRNEKLKHFNKHLKSNLMTDSLTGLLNRRAFDQAIKDVDDRGYYSFIFLDIVLRKVGETIQACVRASDRVYRYGGEEITLILMDCDKKNALKMAEKIRSEISQLDHQAYPQITVSLGVSSYPDDGLLINDLIVASDKALLKAKQSGKNRTISC